MVTKTITVFKIVRFQEERKRNEKINMRQRERKRMEKRKYDFKQSNKLKFTLSKKKKNTG